MPGSILFVHQGYELYGSDRTLIQSVAAAAARWPNARITVLLPSDGVLRAALLAHVSDVRIVDLAILRKSNLKKLKIGDIGRLAKKIRTARQMMRAYDLTYINTVMVMDYILAASITQRPRIVHVHEIPTGVVALFFSALLTLSRAFIVFNSRATRRSFILPFGTRSTIVWNGVAAPAEALPITAHDKLNLLLIGRFNAWKGQTILLHAVAALPIELRARVSVRLVGSVFGDQNHFEEELVGIISRHDLSAAVQIFPFTPDPSPHYSWADIVVVPSTRPEPFGLVAIEAMAAARCVIAANHGGLSEIVVDSVTGTFVQPGSVESLTEAIAGYIENPLRAQAEGIAGRERFMAQFEESHYKSRVTSIIEKLCAPASA